MRPISDFITLFFICAVFFFLGFFGYAKFYRMVLPDVPGIQYRMDLAQVISNQDFFSIIMAAVPLLLYVTWQMIPLRNMDKKTLSVFIVIICMAALFLFAIKYWRQTLQNWPKAPVIKCMLFPFHLSNLSLSGTCLQALLQAALFLLCPFITELSAGKYFTHKKFNSHTLLIILNSC